MTYFVATTGRASAEGLVRLFKEGAK